MTIEVDTFEGPEYLASMLINGYDEGSLDESDEGVLTAFLESIYPWHVVDVARDEKGEPLGARFTNNFRLFGGNAQSGNVISYVCHRN